MALITGDAVNFNISSAKNTFPLGGKKCESPGGPTDMLLGRDHMDEAPREYKRRPGLILYKFGFITGYVVCGNMAHQKKQTHAYSIN
jgi:hypothetical protein